MISLFILFSPIKSLKYNLWKLTPYDYTFLLKFPNYFENKSLLNEFNRIEISSYLEKNYNRNFLNVDFWNKKLFIDDYSKNINNDFEQSFINIFLLTKNNQAKNFELKKYFIFNYDYFTEKNKKIVIENLSRRVGMPLYIPLVSIITSFLLFQKKEKKYNFIRKYILFTFAFIILIVGEVLLRFSGFSMSNFVLYFFSPIILIGILYTILLKKTTSEKI